MSDGRVASPISVLLGFNRCRIRAASVTLHPAAPFLTPSVLYQMISTGDCHLHRSCKEASLFRAEFEDRRHVTRVKNRSDANKADVTENARARVHKL